MIEFVNLSFPNIVMILPDKAAADRYMQWDGGHPEAHLVAWAKSKFADSGGVFVDVGANCGIWTMHMADAFASVEAFEPSLDVFARLTAGIALSDIPRERIRAHCVALGSKKSRGILRAKGTDAFDGSLVAYRDEVVDRHDVVHVVPLDDKLPAERRAALVKIDVEGFEFDVLRGAEGFLKASGLPPIVFECWDDRTRGQSHFIEDDTALLENMGYKVTKLDWPEEYLAVAR